jgi:hypothetical protein
MKKLLVTLLILPVLIIPARANAGPSYMYANPGLELAVDAHCPIIAEHEDLTFDFSGGERGDWSPTAKVTASYTMTNPTNTDVSVTMAFPFVTRFADAEPGLYAVRVDGQDTEYDLYYGNALSEDETELMELNFADMLSNVTLQAPEGPGEGMVYTILADTSRLPESTERFHLRMKLSSESVCYLDGFNGITSQDDGTAEVNAWIYRNTEDRLPTIFVPGGPLLDYSIEAYESHDSETPLEGVSLTVQPNTTGFRTYMKTCLTESGIGIMADGDFSEGFYWALLSEANREDHSNRYGNYVFADQLLSSVGYNDRLAMAVYTVEFQKGETKNVTVECALNGIMERPNGYLSTNTTYTYTYLSKPAEEWAEFGTLSVTVIPPLNLPVSSSVPELTEDGTGRWSALLPGLPESNIRFTLGTPAGETGLFGGLFDLVFRNFVVLSIAIGGVALIAGAMILILLLRKKRR